MTDHQDEQVNPDPVTVEQTDAITAALRRERYGYELREAAARKKLAAISNTNRDDAAISKLRVDLDIEIERAIARQEQIDAALAQHGVKPTPRGNARTAQRLMPGRQDRS
jgi:hypothetical protein